MRLCWIGQHQWIVGALIRANPEVSTIHWMCRFCKKMKKVKVLHTDLLRTRGILTEFKP